MALPYLHRIRRLSDAVIVLAVMFYLFSFINFSFAATYPISETTSRFQAPVSGRTVRPFSPGKQRWNTGHRGVDLAATVGEKVRASGSGIITYAGRIVDRSVVVIDHGPAPEVPIGERLYTVYEPVIPLVRKGTHVMKGQIIGTVAAGKRCGGHCIYWGAHWSHGRNIQYLDPWTLVDYLPVSLLPWVDMPRTRSF